jgi:hypothetical protein
VTKRDAAEKVAKLMRLARGTSSPEEAASARAQATKIAQEHGLGPADLEVGQMGAAWDDLVDQVGRLVGQRTPAMPRGLFDVGPIVADVLRTIKSIKDTDKASRLRQVTTAVRAASFVAGDHNQTIAELKRTLDTVLKNHELVI